MAVGSGWQAYVAYINVGCYYLIGLPGGILMEILFHFGVPVSFVSLFFCIMKLQALIDTSLGKDSPPHALMEEGIAEVFYYRG